MRRRLRAAALILSLAAAAAFQSAKANDVIRLAVLPYAAEGGDAAFDEQGRLHVVYSEKGKVFYTVQPKGGAAFEKPQLVAQGGPKFVIADRERGPKLALGSPGHLYVVWQSDQGMRFARSGDSGKSWSLVAVRDAGAAEGVDMPAIAADARNVYVLWVDYRDPKMKGDAYASNLYLDVSGDGGKTFGPDRKITPENLRACPCCQPVMVVDEKGILWIAYRTSQENVKEIYLFKSDPKIAAFEPIRLSEDRWYLEGCPMSGPSLAVDAKGRGVVAAWSSQGDLFWTARGKPGSHFSGPRRAGKGRYHAAAAAGDGSQLLIWEEGDRLAFQLSGVRTLSGHVDLQPGGKLLATENGDFLLLKFQSSF